MAPNTHLTGAEVSDGGTKLTGKGPVSVSKDKGIEIMALVDHLTSFQRPQSGIGAWKLAYVVTASYGFVCWVAA
jgi:hypothetical protein